MKKFIYLSIVLITLSSISCRNQDDMFQPNEVELTTNSVATINTNSTTYQSFDSSAIQQGDPAHPPQD